MPTSTRLASHRHSRTARCWRFATPWSITPWLPIPRSTWRRCSPSYASSSHAKHLRVSMSKHVSTQHVSKYDYLRNRPFLVVTFYHQPAEGARTGRKGWANLETVHTEQHPVV